MSGNPNKLLQFWQELKRRKVTRTITVYAAAAFVILELVDIIAPNLGLPVWTFNLVLILVCIGFIITVIISWIYDIHPKGGFVKTEPAYEAKKVDIPPSSNSWKITSYISFVVIVALVVYNIFRGNTFTKIDESLEKSIAVLPFHNYSGDPKQDPMCLGMTDEIISHLFKVTSFDEVRSLTSVLPYKDSEKSATEIAEALRVNYILEGSYKRISDELRVTAQLIDTKSDKHIWLQDYDMPYDEVIGIPAEIAFQIADHLKAFITEEEQQRIEKKPTNNLDAYEYYLMGKSQMYRYRGEGDEETWLAVKYFKQAVSIDHSFAHAYSGLAEAYYQVIDMAIQSPKDVYPKAKASALKALSLDDRLADSHCILALIKTSFEYDFYSAEQEYKRALEIDPKSFEAHLYYSSFLSVMGRHDEAVSLANIATELDPLSTLAETSRIVIQYYAGYRSEAVDAMETFRDSDPENPYGYWFCAVFYADLGRYREALSMLKIQIILMGDDNISDEVGLQGYLHGRLGQREKALKQLDQLDILSSEGYYIDPRARIWVYLGLNEIDRAIEILTQALKEYMFDPSYFMIYPSEFVQLDPRFIELKNSIGIIE